RALTSDTKKAGGSRGEISRAVSLTHRRESHAAFAKGTASTRIVSANAAPIANRAVQTWQTTIVWDETSLTTCPSPKPISRRRIVISGDSGSRLIRTDAPARARLSGHNGCASQ